MERRACRRGQNAGDAESDQCGVKSHDRSVVEPDPLHQEGADLLSLVAVSVPVLHDETAVVTTVVWLATPN